MAKNKNNYKVINTDDLTIYNHPTYGEIRTYNENDSTWFIASDVLNGLQYSTTKTTQLLKILDDSETSKVYLTFAPNSNHVRRTMNIEGLKKFLKHSLKPEAIELWNWIKTSIFNDEIEDEVDEDIMTDTSWNEVEIEDTALSIFKNEELGKVRSYVDDKGNPWFIAKDVCDILEYKNSRKAINDNCKIYGVTTSYTIDFTGKRCKVQLINEPNVFRLILRSKLPKAERVEKWVMEEVLPTLWKTGRYAIPTLNRTPTEAEIKLHSILYPCTHSSRYDSRLELMYNMLERLKDDLLDFNASIYVKLHEVPIDTVKQIEDYVPITNNIVEIANNVGMMMSKISFTLTILEKEWKERTIIAEISYDELSEKMKRLSAEYQELRDIEIQYNNLYNDYDNLYDVYEAVNTKCEEYKTMLTDLQKSYNDLVEKHINLVREYETLKNSTKELSKVQNLLDAIKDISK